MSNERHMLQGRTDEELYWFRRRSFLAGAAAWTAMGGFGAAFAQQRSNIVELKGEALLNERPLQATTIIQTGDKIETGPNSNLVFVVGNASFLVRQNSRITVERGDTINAVSVLRMVTGAVASVWGKGQSRQIITPTLTAGIRGTGVYTEVFPQQDSRSYFCNCYGVVELSAGRDASTSTAEYHQSFWGEVQPKDGKLLTAAPPINHTDEELEMLAQLVDQRTAWQITGRKGQKASDAGGGSGSGGGYGAASSGGGGYGGGASGGASGGYGAAPAAAPGAAPAAAPRPASGGYGGGGPSGSYR